MKKIDFSKLQEKLKNKSVPRPNAKNNGTLSGHAAGEPFEKQVYKILKSQYEGKIFKQYEYLNELFLKNSKKITLQERHKLIESPTAFFLFSRGVEATTKWSPENIFEEKQNDTADIIFYENSFYNIIDVKTRNLKKKGQAPNIISAYKLARMCGIMLDNEEFDNIEIDYIGIDWVEEKDKLQCLETHHCNLFRINPKDLYINWSAGMQIQFHVHEISQSWNKTRKEWAVEYLKVFVASAEARCDKIRKDYIKPFLKYIKKG